ncbi:MAG TPA: BrnT family toxin [Reyranella sp.]
MAAIESLFAKSIAILPDPQHSAREKRLKAIGFTAEGRAAFLIFTVRRRRGHRLIRPISARYMHAKEVRAYEKAIAGTEE